MSEQKNHEESIQRLEKILIVCLKKLKTAVCLPFLLDHHQNVILKILKPSQVEYLQEIREFPNAKITDLGKHLSASKISMKFILEVSYTNTEIMNLIEEHGKHVSPEATKFLNDMKMFIDRIEIRMRGTLKKELEREIQMQNATRNLHKTEAEVKDLQLKIEEETKKCENIVRQISEEISEHELAVSQMKEEFEKYVRQRLEQSETEMIGTSRKMEEEKDQLEKEILHCKTKYELLLEKNINSEKHLRLRRKNVEAEYLSVLAKYDEDIGTCYETKQNLEEELKIVNNELSDYQERLMLQAAQYHRLREEREQAILKAFTEDLNNFTRNRAAKIIQRTWRAYYARVCSRKKKKPKKKGKK